jgi:hypothetical protein
VNSVDRVVEEHRVIPGPVLRVFLWFVSDGDASPEEELAMEAVDLSSAALYDPELAAPGGVSTL